MKILMSIIVIMILGSYFIQRYIMKLSNKEILILLKYDWENSNKIKFIFKVIIGCLLLTSLFILGPGVLVLLIFYFIIILI